MTIEEFEGCAGSIIYYLAFGVTVREVKGITVDSGKHTPDKERAIVEYTEDGYSETIKIPVDVKHLYLSVEDVIKEFARRSLRLLDKQYEITVKEI